MKNVFRLLCVFALSVFAFDSSANANGFSASTISFMLLLMNFYFPSFTTYEDGHIAYNNLNTTFTNVHPIIP